MITKRAGHSMWISPKTLGDKFIVINSNSEFFNEQGRLQRSRVEDDGRITVLVWFQVTKNKGHLVMMDWSDVQRIQ